MVGGERAELGGQPRAVEIRQLLRVQLDRQGVGPRGLENPADLGGAEGDALAEAVHGIRRALGRHRRDHVLADEANVAVGIATVFRRNGMGPQEGGADRDRPRLPEAPGGAQHLEFVAGGQAVAGLDLDRRRTLADEGVEARQRAGDQRVLARRPGRGHRRGDAPARLGDLLVARAGEAKLELGGAVAAIDQVRVAVDEPGRHPAPLQVDPLRGGHAGRQVRHGADPGDPAVPRRDGAKRDLAIGCAARPHGPDTGVDPHSIKVLRHVSQLLP